MEKSKYRHYAGTAICAFSIFVIAGCAQNHEKLVAAQPASITNGHERSDANIPQTETDPLQETWGIKVESTRLSAGGYMIDFRYRVLDPEKAKPLLDGGIHPTLKVPASGAVFGVPSPPKVGQLRNVRDVKKDKVYFIFFANPGQYIKPGEKVNVIIGDCVIENLTVE
jgi:hypothetical protein